MKMKHKIAVCLVEDMRAVRESIERALENDESFLCLSAFGNGEDALKRLPGLYPDVVLMDINLPGMNGIECIQKLKEKCSETQFMMFTIYENEEQIFDALAAGASGYMTKKTPVPRLLDALRELYQGGAPMNAHIARKVVAAFQRAKPHDPSSGLSARENEVVQLLAKGFLYKEIASKLNISTGTVRQHIHNIYEKLHVQNRTEALNKIYGRR